MLWRSRCSSTQSRTRGSSRGSPSRAKARELPTGQVRPPPTRSCQSDPHGFHKVRAPRRWRSRPRLPQLCKFPPPHKSVQPRCPRTRCRRPRSSGSPQRPRPSGLPRPRGRLFSSRCLWRGVLESLAAAGVASRVLFHRGTERPRHQRRSSGNFLHMPTIQLGPGNRVSGLRRRSPPGANGRAPGLCRRPQLRPGCRLNRHGFRCHLHSLHSGCPVLLGAARRLFTMGYGRPRCLVADDA